MTEKSYTLRDGVIESARILLRPITAADTPLIVKWRNTESVRRNFIFREPFTAEMHENWLRTRVATGQVIQYIIVDRESGESVGSVYFRDVDRKNHSAEYGIFIGEEAARGKGLGSETARVFTDFGFEELKLHRISHTFVRHSETAGTLPVPAETVRFSLSKEKGSPDSQRFLTLYEGDTSLAGTLLRKKPAHALIADLPYGVQHAPQSGKKPEPFDRLLSRALPAWKEALRPGGALAVSFNTLTLKTETVRSLLAEAGFLVCDSPVFSGLIHSVEQAVVRDLVFATVPNHSQA